MTWATRARTTAVAGLPAPAARWTGLAKYSFVGGNNDPEQVPVEVRIEQVLARLSETEACGFDELFADISARYLGDAIPLLAVASIIGAVGLGTCEFHDLGVKANRPMPIATARAVRPATAITSGDGPAPPLGSIGCESWVTS